MVVVGRTRRMGRSKGCLFVKRMETNVCLNHYVGCIP